MFGVLTRRAGGVAVAQAALAAGAVATDMLLAWMLDRSTNGLLQSAFIVTRVAVLAGALGVPTSLYFLFPRAEEGERGRLIRQSFAILAAVGAVLGTLIWAGAPWMVGWLGQPDTVTGLLRAGSLAVAFGLPALLAEPILIVSGRPWLASANAAVGALLQVALIASALALWKRPEGVFPALALTSALRLGLPLIFVWRQQRIASAARPAVPWRRAIATQMAVAFPIGLTAAIDAVSSYLDRAVVARHFSPAELALYRYGAQEVPLIGLVIGALTPVLLPRFSVLLQEEKPGEVLELWKRAAAKTAVVLFGIFWALLWVAPEFLAVLYSPLYRDAALYFRVYLILLPLRVVACMPMLYALGRGRFVALVAGGEVLLNLVLALLLIRFAGAGPAGAAWATVLATAVQALIYLTAIRQGLGCRWSVLLPWGNLSRSLLRAGLFFLPLGFLKAVPVPDSLMVGAALFWGGVYLYAIALPRLRAEAS